MTLTVDTLTTWMNKFADKVSANKQYLSDLDTPSREIKPWLMFGPHCCPKLKSKL
ncbi:hypothetical protein [Lactobacillus sp. ESL0791]|uniref:hypothetical protein n=1 Tax=Lactobacillus sp. ESL0791 TaxID=2983234 RepID=UPI0035AC0001